MAQILFKNANLLDPHADELQGGVSVVVEGESIREVSAKAIKAANADVIDCKGRTLMPGLIDCHVHVMLSEVNIRYLEAVPLTMMTVRAAALMCAMIDRGFTTVRDTGGADWGSRRGGEGLLPGPRMFIAGRDRAHGRHPMLAPTPGRVPASAANAMRFCLRSSTASTRSRGGARAASAGVDQIKIMGLGRSGEP
jgi:imidazolonepropionase-like amidohydrolase